jgi:hypothetical protein
MLTLPRCPVIRFRSRSPPCFVGAPGRSIQEHLTFERVAVGLPNRGVLVRDLGFLPRECGNALGLTSGCLLTSETQAAAPVRPLFGYMRIFKYDAGSKQSILSFLTVALLVRA